MARPTSRVALRPVVFPEEKQEFQARALKQRPAQALVPARRRLARPEQLRERPGCWEQPVQSQREEQAPAPLQRYRSLPNKVHRVSSSVS
jgi:hypothetical protein